MGGLLVLVRSTCWYSFSLTSLRSQSARIGALLIWGDNLGLVTGCILGLAKLDARPVTDGGGGTYPTSEGGWVIFGAPPCLRVFWTETKYCHFKRFDYCCILGRRERKYPYLASFVVTHSLRVLALDPSTMSDTISTSSPTTPKVLAHHSPRRSRVARIDPSMGGAIDLALNLVLRTTTGVTLGDAFSPK